MPESNRRRIKASEPSRFRSPIGRAQLAGCAFLLGLSFAVAVDAAQARPDEVAWTTAGSFPKTLFEAIWGYQPSEGRKEQSEDERRLEPDRPHFPEASTTVGLGRAVVESGYTFTTKGNSLVSHSAPEALLRVGMLADWFEFRIGQNFIDQQQTVAGTTKSAAGAQDLYLGVKLAVTEQNGLLPAVAIIPQMTVPTGSRALTADRILPGVNVDSSWEVIKNLFSIEVLVANNLVQDDLGDIRHELATGLTGVYQITKKVEGFAEWDAFYPTGGVGPIGPRHQVVAGLVYFVTADFAVDARVGAGLNSRSNAFLAGVGFAARF